jgi:hypothetical protein
MTETMCCPLSNDGDSITVLFDGIIAGRKEYACTECRMPIAKGTRHELIKGMWEGDFCSYRTCLRCVEIRDHFACGSGWLFGEVWSQLEESFYPDMKCGGQCMTGLSPAAKAFLIEKRMEWYYARGEAPNDGLWEGWTPDKPPRPPKPEPPEPARTVFMDGDDPAGNGWG